MEIVMDKQNIWKGRLRSFWDLLFRARFLLAAFLMTYGALLVFAIIRKLAPFGENSLLSIDLHGQYYPMMAEKLSDFFSVWSWDGSLGFSSLVQSAYYTNSIFLILLAPFSGYARIAALDLMIFFKIALAAVFFTYYLEKKHGKRNVFAAVFGVAYALSAYMTAFISQPMWMDIVLLLPLVLLGLEKMMRGESPLSYTLFLALAIFSNFYISFALCLFLVLWFLVTLISEKSRSWKALAVCGGKFAGFSVIAAMLCAFMLLPLVHGMNNWISSSLSFGGEIKWYHGAAAIADSFSAGVKSSREYGAANVFCGSASILFALLFLLNREIPLKKRLAQFSLAVFLFLSFEINLLDFIWHGLHFPNQLPARQSFLFIFVLLLMAYETILFIKGLSVPKLGFSFVLSALFFMIGIGKSANAEGRAVSVSVIVIVFLSLFMWRVFEKKTALRRTFSAVLALVLLSESIACGIYTLCRYAGSTDAVSYAALDADMKTVTDKYESGKDDFYRTELTPNFTFNTGQLYGFKGMTYYSSTMNGDIYRLFESLGDRVYAKNVSSVYQPTPMQDMMFGVKYHYMRGGWWIDYAKRIEKTEKISVYESPYALPVAYVVHNDVKDTMTVDEEDPQTYEGIALQGRFISLASGLGEEVVKKALSAEPLTRNGTLNGDYLIATDTDSPTYYYMEFFAQDDGYFYFDFDFTVGNYTAYVNGTSKRTGSCGGTPLTCMGYVKKGDLISVEVKIQGYRTILRGINGWTVDKDALDRAHAALSEGGMQVSSASDTHIEGLVTASRDGVLYSSVPAENGWSVYVDGVKQETFDLGLGLLACDIEAGVHMVEYRYLAPGLVPGVCLSVLGAALLFAYCYFEKRKELPR